LVDFGDKNSRSTCNSFDFGRAMLDAAAVDI
jgi:hypothetical protein